MGILIQNKDIFRNYEVLEKFEAGISLYGFEVKSIFTGKGSLKGSYISKRNNELYLINFYIPPYQENNIIFKNYDPYRPRKLLLKRKEINYLINRLKTKGLTLIPVKVYNKNNLIKVEIALAKGLKKYEKREKLKERDYQRLYERKLKRSSFYGGEKGSRGGKDDYWSWQAWEALKSQKCQQSSSLRSFVRAGFKSSCKEELLGLKKFLTRFKGWSDLKPK